MAKKQKLELTWIGKDERPRLEPRILLEDKNISYHAAHRISDKDIFDNILIKGDNLLALKALEQEFTGKIKCVYIDPPYNTGSAFAHYDDGIEHSLWLSLIRDRLEILRKLLSKDGIIFVSIDDTQVHYLKVLMDEVFGRKNYCGQFVWEKKKKPSFLDGNMGGVTENVLAYSPNRINSPAFIGGKTEEGKKYPFNNAGNGLKTLTFPTNSVIFRCSDGIYKAQDMSGGNIVTRLLDDFEVLNSKNITPFRLEGEWRYSQKKLNEIVELQESIIISQIPFRPNHIKSGGEPKKLKNLLSIAHYEMATYEDASKESIDLFGDGNAFDYPKPEKLISFLINAVTEEGDLVLDSFGGSGTTGAVAHKMRRRWIMVELGEHCNTHIVPRLKKVIDDEDAGGITKAVEWKGGGGFRFYELAPSLLKKDKWDNYIINPEYNAEMLAEALCKHLGFTYEPSDTVFWEHGHSTESDFIYVTTQQLSRETLQKISDEVGDERTLLICCKAFRAGEREFPNLTLQKIPKTILGRCEWDRDDYSLQVQNLPLKPEEKGTQPVFSFESE
jgi:adenine-specific DNA-methyltransferase